MKRFFPSVALGLLALNLCGAASAESGAKLNFVFILVDDLGWTDLRCQGSKFYETPNIDRLARASIVPLLRQHGGLRRDTIYWHYPHYHPGGATPYSAIRQSDWKLVEFFEDDRAELYNLRDDIGEQNDLAVKLPDRANALREKLHTWRKEVGAQLPAANPAYDPRRAETKSAK